jgi:hypothetical protein
MSSIKDKFGTDWISTPLGGASQTRGVVSGSGDQREANHAFLTLGKQIYRLLKDTGGGDKLYNLAGKMKLEPQDIEPVVAWMASLYYIRVEPDKYGNHDIQLTSKASELNQA